MRRDKICENLMSLHAGGGQPQKERTSDSRSSSGLSDRGFLPDPESKLDSSSNSGWPGWPAADQKFKVNTARETNQDPNRKATLANLAMFDYEETEKWVDRAPHLRHAQVWKLYAQLVLRVFNTAKQFAEMPRVLDLGAGQGTATLPLLELGAFVTAVDISQSQLAALVKRCDRFSNRLEVHHQELHEILRRREDRYDVVVMNSVLHHIPNYLSVIDEAISMLGPHGQFFSFQDPLRYDTLESGTRFFTNLAYFGWRMFQGNYIQGLNTRIRRLRGIYIPGSEEDDAEYHITRNGVDQDAIEDLFKSKRFACEVIRYFSTQNPVLQPLGTSLGIENTFAIIAQMK